MKILISFVGAIILAFIIGLLITFFLVPLVSAANIYENTLDAENVVFNYEWFKLQYNDYLSLKAKIEIAEEEADSYKQASEQWTDNQRKEYERLASIAIGLKYQLQDVISEYNARSSMLNRRELSRKSGLHDDAIQRIEAGEYKPTKNTCQRIADALEVDLSEIYGTDGTMDKVNLLRAALIEVEERLDVICKVVDATNSFLERIDSEDAEIDEQAHKCLTQVMQILKR